MTPPPEAASCARECAQGTAKPPGIGTSRALDIHQRLVAGSVSVRRGLVRRLAQLLDLTFERSDPFLERCEHLGDVLPARDQDPSPGRPSALYGRPIWPVDPAMRRGEPWDGLTPS